MGTRAWLGLLPVLTAAAFATCTAAATTPAPSPPGTAILRVQGKVEYEKVPITSSGLSPGQKFRAPCAGVVVELVTAAGETKGTTLSDATGSFQIWADCTLAGPCFLRTSARLENAQVRHDVLSPPYELRGRRFALVSNSPPVTQNLLARDANRLNGAFNVLANVRRANQFLREQVDSAIELPVTTFLWHQGLRGDSSVSGDTVQLAGRRASRSDEFDDGIILAAYGRRLLAHFGGDDDPGLGPDILYPLDALDPRVAWSQGWGFFFACACLGEPVLRNSFAWLMPDRSGDTYPWQLVSEYDLETGMVRSVLSAGPAVGFDEPLSVSAVLWDLYDAGSNPDEGVSLDFRTIWLAATNPLGGRHRRYLQDLVETLLQWYPSLAPGLESILHQRGLASPPRETWPPALPTAPPGEPNASGTIIQRNVPSGAARRDASVLFGVSCPDRSDLTLWLELTGRAHTGRLRLRLLDLEGREVAWGITQHAPRGAPSVTITARSLAAGQYVIVIDAFDPDRGIYLPQSTRFSLRVVRLTPARPAGITAGDRS